MTTDYSIRVMIVESFRQKGKPRQRVIKYLGSIRRQNLRSLEEKHRFITAMKNKIDRMDDLTFQQQTTVKLSLLRAVFHLH